MNFLDKIPEDDNLIFTTRQSFWEDFVSGKIDEDSFLEYYQTLDHGTANFIKTDENGKTYLDKVALLISDVFSSFSYPLFFTLNSCVPICTLSYSKIIQWQIRHKQ